MSDPGELGEWERVVGQCREIVVDLSTVYDKMCFQPAFYGALELLSAERRAKGGGQGDLMDQAVTKVEVAWEGRVELLSFATPKEAKYFSPIAKVKVLKGHTALKGLAV